MKGLMLGLCVLGSAMTGWSAANGNESSQRTKTGLTLRGSLGTAPGISEAEFIGTHQVDDDTGGKLEFLAVQRFWNNQGRVGAVLGGGLFFAGHSGTDTVAPLEYDLGILGAVGEAGIAFKLGERVVIEAVPYLGVGSGTVELTDTSTNQSDDGDASYFLYGVKSGIFFIVQDAIELGLEVGYEGFSSDSEVKGSSSDLSLSGDGLHVAAVFSVRF